MTSREQNASDRPHADANRLAVQAGSAGRGAGYDWVPPGSATPGAPVVGEPVTDGEGSDTGARASTGTGAGAGVRSGAAAPGVVEWSPGAWGVGGPAGPARPQRRPAPSRRLSQVRAVPAVPDGFRVAAAEEAAAGVGGVPVDLVGVPMGVLIGGSPGSGESSGQGGRAPDRRVSAELLRFGSGTCQVVLPEWRPAIAVSVPTEQLQRSTGLGPEELRSARLSVVINPEAVHDRELGLRDWRAEIPAARGRRRGRRQLR
ncbi:hypothetical protein ABZ747_09810 [Kitasatospora cineracea]|uniref:hypothetical protein n=1 Tax=Kitasatospora cineracea TaxID=88074 RepID=UPI0033ED68B7